MKLSDLIIKVKKALIAQGEPLTPNDDYGVNTTAALDKYDVEIILKKKPVVAPSEKNKAPWYIFGLKFKGKNENDPEFNKEMSSKWGLVNLNLGTIAKSWAAWCGLAVAVTLAGVGIKVQKDGGSARAWGEYGHKIEWQKDGIPQGAIVHINHNLDCKSSKGNHVSQANGDCAVKDLLKKGATIDLYGGNQGNTWKVSTYAVAEICNVRWPKEIMNQDTGKMDPIPKPDPILVSKKCSFSKKDNESTQ